MFHLAVSTDRVMACQSLLDRTTLLCSPLVATAKIDARIFVS